MGLFFQFQVLCHLASINSSTTRMMKETNQLRQQIEQDKQELAIRRSQIEYQRAKELSLELEVLRLRNELAEIKELRRNKLDGPLRQQIEQEKQELAIPESRNENQIAMVVSPESEVMRLRNELAELKKLNQNRLGGLG